MVKCHAPPVGDFRTKEIIPHVVHNITYTEPLDATNNLLPKSETQIFSTPGLKRTITLPGTRCRATSRRTASSAAAALRRPRRLPRPPRARAAPAAAAPAHHRHSSTTGRPRPRRPRWTWRWRAYDSSSSSRHHRRRSCSITSPLTTTTTTTITCSTSRPTSVRPRPTSPSTSLSTAAKSRLWPLRWREWRIFGIHTAPGCRFICLSFAVNNRAGLAYERRLGLRWNGFFQHDTYFLGFDQSFCTVCRKIIWTEIFSKLNKSCNNFCDSSCLKASSKVAVYRPPAKKISGREVPSLRSLNWKTWKIEITGDFYTFGMPPSYQNNDLSPLAAFVWY